VRVLITGAGGTLGTALAPLLASAGYTPVLFDVRPLETPYEFVQGDVRKWSDVRAAAEGVDLVVHTAAIHGIHLRDHTPREFYDLNLTGTFNMWEAAAEVKVRGVVFSSTMGVYGESRRPAGDQAVAVLHEEMPLLPGDIYGFTKVAGEEMCRYYGRAHGIPSVALRYGMFVPEPFFRYGIRLLYGGVDAADVARAVLAACEALASLSRSVLSRSVLPAPRGRFQWDAFNVESHVPFSPEDGPQLRQDPLPVVEKYYPGAVELLRSRGVQSLQPIREYFPMSAAASRLGFRPECNFDQWLEQLQARPEERAEKNPPWP
jgi:nucleoside-diphosphate-sugar epimerase